MLCDKGLSGDAAFAQIGDWCRMAVKDGEERCFRGVGNIITSVGPPSSVVDAKQSILVCRQISAGDHLAFKYCVEDIANSFTVNPKTRKEVPCICSVLTGREILECEIRVGVDVTSDL